MKNLSRILFVSFLGMLLLWACQKESSSSGDQNIDTRSSSNSDDVHRDDTFFDGLYVNDLLDLTDERPMMYRVVTDIRNEFELNFKRNGLLQGLKDQNLYPCWWCAEVEFIESESYYIPFYNIETAELNGLLIAEFEENILKYYYLSDSAVKTVHNSFPNEYSNYWTGIMDFFKGGTKGKTRDGAFKQASICVIGTVTCICTQTFKQCGPNVIEYGPGSNWNCHKYNSDCRSQDSGSDDGDGGPNPTDDPGVIIIHGGGIGGWLGNNNDECCGTNGGDITPPVDYDALWAEHCGSFNGSLAFADMGGEMVTNEEEGIIALTTPEQLYQQQIQSFINGTQLPFTVDEVQQAVGEQCAVSFITDVHDCLKCHFISELGLSGEQSYYVNENFDIYVNCIDEPSPDCVSCSVALDLFIEKYELALSQDELMDLVGNINDVSCTDQQAYNEEIISSLFDLDENGILHINIDPIDMISSTDLEVLNQILKVINLIQLYFCEGNDYEPIDWRDYFDNYGSASGTVNRNECDIAFDINGTLPPHYLMDTSPSWSQDVGDRWTYKWAGYDTNFPMLQITVDYECTESLENEISIDCE